MRTEPQSEFGAAILGQIAPETTDSALGAQLPSKTILHSMNTEQHTSETGHSRRFRQVCLCDPKRKSGDSTSKKYAVS